MMEFLRFAFEDGWHFAGIFLLASLAAYAVSGWFQIHRCHEEEE